MSKNLAWFTARCLQIFNLQIIKSLHPNWVYLLTYLVCVCHFPSGDSRGSAKPATRHQGPFGSFTRAVTALGPTSSGTADSAPTLAAAHLTKPPLLRWPSTAPLADCYSELWWWSTRASVTTTAPTRRSEILLFGRTGPDQPLWELHENSKTSLTDTGNRTVRETLCIIRWIHKGILWLMDLESENDHCR